MKALLKFAKATSINKASYMNSKVQEKARG
jgi:hypothetical protein